jgi:hypothetical protein
MEVIPSTEDQRKAYLRLLSVLDRAFQLLACKHSIAGLLSAQDDMGAIDQIQYGRRLLAGDSISGGNDTDDDVAMDDGVELNKLLAVQTVADQLSQ